MCAFPLSPVWFVDGRRGQKKRDSYTYLEKAAYLDDFAIAKADAAAAGKRLTCEQFCDNRALSQSNMCRWLKPAEATKIYKAAADVTTRKLRNSRKGNQGGRDPVFDSVDKLVFAAFRSRRCAVAGCRTSCCPRALSLIPPQTQVCFVRTLHPAHDPHVLLAITAATTLILPRDKGRRVSQGWLERRARSVYAQLRPGPDAPAFKAGPSWRRRFAKRHIISVQKRTNKKRLTLAEVVPALQQWHKGVAAMVASKPDPARTVDPVYGRFPPQFRLNVDQVPCPYVIKADTTYETIGTRTVQARPQL